MANIQQYSGYGARMVLESRAAPDELEGCELPRRERQAGARAHAGHYGDYAPRAAQSAQEGGRYSLRDLSDRSGLDYSMISKLENGRRGAQGRTVRKLAEALDVPTSSLVG